MSDRVPSYATSHTAVKQVLAISELKKEFGKVGADEFRKKYAHSFLVLRYSPQDDSDWIDIKTVETSTKKLSQEADHTVPILAVALQKSDRNTYSSKITVGRAKNNDIVIRAPKISKLHCAFRLKKRGRAFELVDMGSSNGTWLNGTRLSKNEASKIKDGDRVTFWRYVFEYLNLDSFISFLNSPT